ncbi:hypothetical protein [Nonomuraea sp. NPDC050786]|uniref:hypothetical protein n=1 Tax=Nonomuraea sp. NPDC050786 TaxID=3154840 RepID=UPI0033FFDB3A
MPFRVEPASACADPHAFADFDVSVLGPQPTAQDVTGRPARTFTQWARAHADDFR